MTIWDRLEAILSAMKTILAAIDFSKISRRVIAEAVLLARAAGGKLVILHAVKPPVIVTDIAPVVSEIMEMNFALERAGKKSLHRLQARLAGQGVTTEAICEQDVPARLIMDHAERLHADFIVIGSHGHTAFYDLVAGSTASAVLKHAKVPVVVIPAAGTNKTQKSRRKTKTPRPVSRG